jgi:hypothetical protein
VDFDRLCSWLGLPPGSWPPEHYALLELPRGAGDVAEVEARVLDRMEQLRPHQLLHPELVTEGMNRLAQALVCLTDPVARAAHDRALGLPPGPVEAADGEPEPSAEPGAAPLLELPPESPATEVDFAPGLRPPGEPQQPPHEVIREREPDPLAYPAEPRAAYGVVPEELPPRPAYEVVPDDELREPEFLPDEGEGRARAESAAVSRRAIYRQLAAVRRALRAWEGLRPVLGTPAEALVTPAAVLLFVRALADARAALPGVAHFGAPGAPGGTVAALVRLPHALHAVRALLPAQRQAVARDWRRGFAALARERRRLREAAFAARPARRRGAAARLLVALRRTPEWLLLPAIFLAALLALLRRKP